MIFALAWTFVSPWNVLALVTQCSRRSFLPNIVGAGLIATNPAIAAADEDILRPPPMPVPIAGLGAPLQPFVIHPWTAPALRSKLGQERIQTVELSPLVPSLSPFADNDLFYPIRFQGTWEVRATLRQKVFPYGVSFVPSKSLIEGSPRYRKEMPDDTPTQYLSRYMTLDDGKKKNKIIADRRFNSIDMTRAYNQLTPVEEVLWDPKKDPTLLKLNFAAGSMTADMMPLGPRRSEIYITGRKREEGEQYFAASERIRQVTLGSGAVTVSDTEIITEFQWDAGNDDEMKAVQRIAVYLTPNPNSREGVLWQQVNGKAVAFFDYEMDMQRSSN